MTPIHIRKWRKTLPTLSWAQDHGSSHWSVPVVSGDLPTVSAPNRLLRKENVYRIRRAGDSPRVDPREDRGQIPGSPDTGPPSCRRGRDGSSAHNPALGAYIVRDLRHSGETILFSAGNLLLSNQGIANAFSHSGDVSRIAIQPCLKFQRRADQEAVFHQAHIYD